MAAGREPQPQDRHRAEEDCRAHGIEIPQFICNQAWEVAAQARPNVQERDELVRESWVDAFADGVGGEVAERDEEAPFHEEDAHSRQGKDRVAEDAEIWEDAFFRCFLGRESRFDAEVCDHEKDQVDEGEDSGAPCPTDLRKEGLQREWVDDSA